MPLTVSLLRPALARCAGRLKEAAAELNERDGLLGDGDLGATLSKCATNVEAVLPTLGDDLGMAFHACSTACAKASGSSFGTLLAIAFLTAAKRTKGRRDLPWSELPDLLKEVRTALSSRGGANLDDKTVLDALAAAEVAIRSTEDPRERLRAARDGVSAALATFRNQPNRIGRARMFADRSVGIDDPGMVAFLRMLEGLALPAESSVEGVRS